MWMSDTMTENDVVNLVFEKYYNNNYLPSEVGGFPYSNLFYFLASIELFNEEQKNEMNILKMWIDGLNVTYYTPKLNKLITLIRFPDDTDEDYLKRLKAVNDARKYGGQSEKSIKILLMSLLNDALNGDDRNIIFVKSSNYSQWDDSVVPTVPNPAHYSIDGEWSDLDTVLGVTFKVKIIFPNTGSDVDPLNYEYWAKPKNYTKIEDLIKIFKPTGSTFNLEITT